MYELIGGKSRKTRQAEEFRKVAGEAFDTMPDELVVRYRAAAQRLLEDDVPLWTWYRWAQWPVVVGVMAWLIFSSRQVNGWAASTIVDVISWGLVVLTVVLGWAVSRSRERRIAERATSLLRSREGHTGRCAGCGYDLRVATSGVCPECGLAIRFSLWHPNAVVPDVETCRKLMIDHVMRRIGRSDGGLQTRIAVTSIFAFTLVGVIVIALGLSASGSITTVIFPVLIAGGLASLGVPWVAGWLALHRQARLEVGASFDPSPEIRRETICWSCGGVRSNPGCCRHCDAPGALSAVEEQSGSPEA